MIDDADDDDDDADVWKTEILLRFAF